MKRLIALRKQYKAFGRGSLEFLSPSNQRVLAFFRRYQEGVILVVANLSRFSQAVQLDLKQFSNYTPVEMFGKTDFPSVSSAPYTLTLGPNSFFWFALEQREAPVPVTSRVARTTEMRLPTVFVPSLVNIWDDNIRASIASILPRYLQTRRWFRSADRRFRSIEITEVIPIKEQVYQLVFVRVEYTTGDPDTYLMPIACIRGDEIETIKSQHSESLIADLKGPGEQRAILFSATDAPEFNTALLEAFARRKRFAGRNGGSVVAHHNKLFRKLWGGHHPDLTPEVLSEAEIATAIRFGDRFVLKVLASIEPGVHPGVEMGEVLSERPASSFSNAAPFAGHLEYESETAGKITLGLLHGFVANDEDAWRRTRRNLDEYLNRMRVSGARKAELQKSAPTRFYALNFALNEPPALAVELIGDSLNFAGVLGRRIGGAASEIAKRWRR